MGCKKEIVTYWNLSSLQSHFVVCRHLCVPFPDEKVASLLYLLCTLQDGELCYLIPAKNKRQECWKLPGAWRLEEFHSIFQPLVVAFASFLSFCSFANIESLVATRPSELMQCGKLCLQRMAFYYNNSHLSRTFSCSHLLSSHASLTLSSPLAMTRRTTKQGTVQCWYTRQKSLLSCHLLTRLLFSLQFRLFE